MPREEWREFIRQQRLIICEKLGHSWALPVQSEVKTEGEEIHVRCVCKTCGDESWRKIAPEKREAFVKALMSQESLAAFFYKGIS